MQKPYQKKLIKRVYYILYLATTNYIIIALLVYRFTLIKNCFYLHGRHVFGRKLLGRVSDEHASFSNHPIADCGYLQRPQLAAFLGRSNGVAVM